MLRLLLILSLQIMIYINVASSSVNKRYLLYDVNTGEGFNLRRDVYIRMANLVRFLNENTNSKYTAKWTLVLPPWGRLYHWFNSRESEISVPWSDFFHLPSLQLFIPVIELDQYLKEYPEGVVVDEVYHLQHFADFGTNWDERVKIEACRADQDYQHMYEKESQEQNALWKGYFFSRENMRARIFHCLSSQMEAANFKDFLLKNTSGTAVLIDRAENLHHGSYSEWSQEWWTARRSMVFSRRLRQIAEKFISTELGCVNDPDRIRDNVHRPENWTKARPKVGSARGCSYLGVHLRRRDFLYAHAHTTPKLNESALQIQYYLHKIGRAMPVFIATDAPDEEIAQLKQMLPNLTVKVFRDDALTDGDRAIVDQIICSRGKNFIATSTSTFSYRILEEREIMGFGREEKGVAFCDSVKRAQGRMGVERSSSEREADEKLSAEERCDQPTHWPVQYESAFSPTKETVHQEL